MTFTPSPGALAKIERTIAAYPEKAAALLPVLHAVQEDAGFVGAEAAAWVAARLGLEPVRIREVLSFYTMFRTAPEGKHTLRICRNLSCHLAGADGILAYLCERLGIASGGTTADGSFTLVTAECLGNCDHAPCLQIDGVDLGPVSRESVAALIEELRAHDRE